MTNEQLIAKFNPANAANLTADDLEIMRSLTDEQIDALADAYPNTPTRRAYLLLYDSAVPPERQLYQMSTWQNLRNVRKYANKKNLVPYTYKSLQQPTRQQAQTTTAVHRQTVPSKKVIVDMSAKDAAAELTASLGQGQAKTGKEATTKTTKTSSRKTKEGQKTTAETSTNVIPPDQDFTNGESESE